MHVSPKVKQGYGGVTQARVISMFMACMFFYMSQPPHSLAREQNPIKIYVGIYPIKLYQFSLKDEQFQADFYLWFRWKGPQKLPEFEIMNGTYETIGDPEAVDLPGGYHYEAHRIKGAFFVYVHLKDYPFDRHNLEIQLENQELDRTEAIYAADKENMKYLTSKSNLTGWETMKVDVIERKSVYPTNFGRTNEAPQSAFSQLVYQIRIERKILPYIIKYSVPLFVIAIMSFCMPFIHPSELEVRAGMGVTAVLSVVAFHISQADTLPEVGYLVAADYFFILAYLTCALSLAETIFTHFFVFKENIPSALRLDHKAKIAFPVLYIVSFALIILMYS